jgi:hypothetical protein
MSTPPSITIRQTASPYGIISSLNYFQSKIGSGALPVLQGEQSNPVFFRIYNNFALAAGLADAINVNITVFDGLGSGSQTASTPPASQCWLHVMEDGFGQGISLTPDLLTKFAGQDTPVGGVNTYYPEIGGSGVASPSMVPGSLRLTTNLLSYYKLDSNSNDFQGTNNGGDTAIFYVNPGVINNCASLNGTTSRIGINSFASTFNGGDFSISAWVYMTAWGAITQMVFTDGAGASNDMQVQLGFTGAGNPTFAFGGDDLAYTGVTNPTGWNMISGTYNRATKVQSLYWNGALAATRTATANPNITPGYCYMGYQTSAATYLNGSIDELGVWSRALHAYEISYLYNAGAGFALSNFTTPSFGYIQLKSYLTPADTAVGALYTFALGILYEYTT